MILLHEPARRKFQTSPEKARADVLATQRQEIRGLYAQFFAELQLTEPQIDALTHLIAEHNVLTTSWSSGGVSFTPKEEDQQLAREVQSKIELSLGPAGFERFKEYQETLREQFQLRRLVQLLIAAGHPLTSEQASQLVSIMKAERHLLHKPPSSTHGTLGYAEELIRRRDEFDRLIKPRFDALLSAEQREFAEQYFAGRAKRRHYALDSYRDMLSTGSRVAFTYPPD